MILWFARIPARRDPEMMSNLMLSFMESQIDRRQMYKKAAIRPRPHRRCGRGLKFFFDLLKMLVS